MKNKFSEKIKFALYIALSVTLLLAFASLINNTNAFSLSSGNTKLRNLESVKEIRDNACEGLGKVLFDIPKKDREFAKKLIGEQLEANLGTSMKECTNEEEEDTIVVL